MLLKHSSKLILIIVLFLAPSLWMNPAVAEDPKPELTPTQKYFQLMNEIYKNYWNSLQNFFLPTFKPKEKIRIGARIRKIYDRPKTPYQRLIESSHVTEEQKVRLRERKKS